MSELESVSSELLLHLMEDISEEVWAAGWLIGLEFILWRNIDQYPELKRLSDLCGGWWVWDGSTENWRRFVPMAEWIEIYKKGEAKV
jgi:hypothetical protein